MRIIELFGGIGACSKALKRLGVDVEIVDYVEIDKYAVKSYNAINGTKFEPQDITKWNKHFDNIDLIMHGSPCQDFSLAGKQAGGDKDSGTRSSLMYETIRIVEDIKPKYVIWENVKNLLSKKHIHNFEAYLETMEQLGYKSYYQVMNTKDYGIPQNRERIFTVSIRKDIDKEFIFPEKQELKIGIKDLLEDKVDDFYYLSTTQLVYVLDAKDVALKSGRNINERIVNPTIAKTISCRGAVDQRADVTNFVIDNCDKELKVKEVKENLKTKLCNYLLENNLVKENDVIRHSYTTSRMNNFYTQNSENNDIAPTLDTRSDCFGVVVKEDEIFKIRKLTPKECWRLMAFDDEDFEKAREYNSRAQLYKQAGNSITVNVLYEIFKKLLGNEIIWEDLL